MSEIARCVVRRLGTRVFLEVFLCYPIKGEGSYGAFETRSDDAPLAVRTAPAGEVFVLGPDHASTHQVSPRPKTNVARNSERRKVSTVRRPMGQEDLSASCPVDVT